MIKFLSVLLSMLLLISAAQVEAEQLKKTTESPIGKEKMAIVLPALAGALAFVGFKTAKAIYDYFNSAFVEQHNSKNPNDKGSASSGSEENKDQHGKPLNPPAAHLSQSGTGSNSAVGFLPIPHNAGRDGLDLGASQLLTGQSSSSNPPPPSQAKRIR